MSSAIAGNFEDRVRIAANFISSGRGMTREFCNCFEMGDGDAVIVALHRRTRKRPGTKLARNMWRYLCRESVASTVWENRHRSDLAELSEELRSRD